MDKVKTMDDVYNHFKNDNNTFIQWKGTEDILGSYEIISYDMWKKTLERDEKLQSLLGD